MGKKKKKKSVSRIGKSNKASEHKPAGKPYPQKAAFSFYQKVLLVGVGIALLVLFEVMVRLLPLGAESPGAGDPFVGFSELHPLFIPYRDSNGVLRMKTAPAKLKWFNQQEFAVEKPPGTYRIFTLGGSTTYGRPYKDPTSFSGFLRKLLNSSPEAQVNFEVINAGGISYASYRVVVLLKELLAYQPDLFVIYTGHNEFLEARTYEDFFNQPTILFKTRELLSGLKTYRLLTRAYRGIRQKTSGMSAGETVSSGRVLPSEVTTLLDRSAGLDYYQRDSLFSRGVFEHFRFNVARMIRLCREAGVQVVFLKPVDNIKDFSPFKSQTRADLDSDGRRRLNNLIFEGISLADRDQPDKSLECFRQAVAIDSLYADAHYFLGSACFQTGDTTRAGKYFLQARELDVCPLRAQEPIHRILREETIKAGVDLIDLPQIFRQASPGGLIGNEMLIDHIHPIPEGNLLIAFTIMNWLGSQGLLPGRSPPDMEDLRDIYWAVMDSLSQDYYSEGVINLAKVLIWADKFNEACLVLDRYSTLIDAEPEAQYLLGTALQKLNAPERALIHFQKSLALEPDHPLVLTSLAKLYTELGQLDSARVTYEKAVELYPDNFAILSNYGILLRELGETDKAHELFSKARDLKPYIPQIRNNLGLNYIKMKKYTQAIKAFEKAIELAPDDPEAYQNLGTVYTLLNQTRQAEQWFLKAISINPDNSVARSNLGNLYLNTGRPELAEEQLRLALIVNPSLLPVYINLARLYQTTERDSLAQETVRQGLELFPGEPELEKLSANPNVD